MASQYKGTLALAPSNSAILRNAQSNDFIFIAANSNQDFHFGCSNSSNIVLTIDSNGIDVKGNINFTGSLLSNGAPFTVNGGGSSTISGWSNYSSNIFTTCNLGIITSNPQSALHIIGDFTTQGHIIPACNNTYDLGTTTNRFKDLKLASDKLELGDGTIIYNYDWNYLKNYVIPPKESNATILRKLFTGVAQDHSAYIANNEVYTFGRNDYGQLGLGDSNIRRTPTKVPNITDAIAVSCGQGFTVVLRSNGQAYSFGNNSNGQLGDGTTNTQLIPTAVLGISNAISVACGYNHVLYCLSDGKVVGYGAGDKGQLGDANSANQTNTTLVYTTMPTNPNSSYSSGTFDLSDYQARFIACGSYHSLMLLNNGQVYTFGDNTSNQLGFTTGTQYNSPQKITSLSNIVKAGCGDSHTIIITQKGQIFGFGNNIKGQLGLGHSNTPITTPTQIFNSNTTISNAGLSMEVDAGLNHTIMSMQDGTLKVFGDNSLGQLGIGSNIPLSLTPFTLLNTNAYKVACGRNHTLVLLTNNIQLSNQIQAFGDNTYGQMGDNNSNITIRYFPNNIYEGTKKRLAVHSPHATYNMTYIDENGVVQISGGNVLRQLGDIYANSTAYYQPYPHIESEVTSVVTGDSYFLCTDINNKIYAWGNYLGVGNNSISSENAFDLSNYGSLSNKRVVQIMTGFQTSFAIDSTGNLHAWGANNYGLLGINALNYQNIPKYVNTFGSIVGKSLVAIAGGKEHTVFLDSTGQVHTTGRNNYGQLGNNSNFTASNTINISSYGSLIGKTIVGIASGANHSFAVDSSGQVHGWGLNTAGQLGNNTKITQSNPINISSFGSLSNAFIVNIGASDSNTLALDSQGRLHAWGTNNGRYGNGLITSFSNPILVNKVGSLTNKIIQQIACFYESTMVLDSEGSIHVFGSNTQGQLGLNDFVTRSNPVLVTSNANNVYSTFVSKGYGDHKLIMNRKSSNVLEIFGDNSYYQIGDNTSNYKISTYDIVFSNTIVQCANSTSHSGVVLDNGQLYLWGNNNHGQCGQIQGGYVTIPTQVTSISNASNVYLGEEYTIIKLSDQTLVSFGNNLYGKLGVNTIDSNTSQPVPITNLSNVLKVSCGQNHSIAITSDCNIYSWGLNTSGQTGLNTFIDSNTIPTLIQGYKAIDVACGKDHSCIVTDNFKLYTCGQNECGQLGRTENFGNITGCSNFGIVEIINTTGKPFRVDCGEKHTIVYLTNNTVRTFGLNSNRQLGFIGSNNTIPYKPSNIYYARGISSGTSTTFIEHGDKTIQAFGKTIASFSAVQIASSYYHSFLISKTGKLYGWGKNDAGQLGCGRTNVSGAPNYPIMITGFGSSSNNTFVSVAAGYDHSLALDINGEVHAWGSGVFGQLGRGSTTSTLVPVKISTFGTLNAKVITKISCSLYTSMALDSTGQLHVWGYNNKGQLGNNTTTNASTPINISSFGSLNGVQVTDICCARYHMLAIDSTGNVHAWGSNGGHLGNNTVITESNPINISTFGSLNGRTITSVKCYEEHSMALDSLGEIHVWGNQTGYYRLGTSNSITYSNPVNIMSNGSLLGKQVTKIACGVNHGIAIDTSNNVHVWGYGTSGQLGNGLSSVFSYPIMISSFSGKGSEHIGAGAFHSIVASSNGEVYVFGRNQDSELGINSTTPSTCNVPILLKLFPTPTGQSNVFINFTGQHRCFIDGYTPQTIPQLEGLIVSANKNKYITNFTTGQQAITINDSLPLVSLTNKPNDKTVFGVVSLTTANNNKYISEEEYDNLLQQGDIRAEINSVGEGAMWVCDANGPLIAGDYITSSHIPGYGMKQDTHILKNYTVAKITMDCDFTAPLISKQQLKKDLYGNKILDPYGQPIWEDTQESEEAYKTRYLLHTGEVISKSNYEAYRLANSNVYKAAFVGVTYHCG